MLSQGILTYRSLTVNPETPATIGGCENSLWKTAAKLNSAVDFFPILAPCPACLLAQSVPLVLQVFAGEFGEGAHRIQCFGRLLLVSGVEGGAGSVDRRRDLAVRDRPAARQEDGNDSGEQGRFRILVQCAVTAVGVIQIGVCAAYR